MAYLSPFWDLKKGSFIAKVCICASVKRDLRHPEKSPMSSEKRPTALAYLSPVWALKGSFIAKVIDALLS